MYDDLQPVSIAGLEFDALLNETKKLTATIPTYAVEDGFSVSDAIINEPMALSLTLYVTNTPVTWLDEHGDDEERIREVIARLEEIWEEKELVKIVTTNAIYTDMGITSISIAHQEGDGYARQVTIEAQKVYQTSRETTLIPSYALKSGSSSASGGSANTSEVSASSTTGTTSGTREKPDLLEDYENIVFDTTGEEESSPRKSSFFNLIANNSYKGSHTSSRSK